MLRLRPYHISDAAKILSWCMEEETFYKWTAGGLGNYPLSEAQFHSVTDSMAFTAIDDEDVVGFLAMRRVQESFDELRFCFVTVDSAKRGMGYGKRMIQLAAKYAKEIYGAKKVSLGVFENNVPAYHCYKAAGFQDAVLKKSVVYTILGKEWKCLELEMEL